MGIGSEIIEVYIRASAFVRAMPLIAGLPLAVEAVRQGLAGFAIMPPYGAAGFSILSTAAMICTLVPALRWWKFDGDRALVWRLRWRVLWGVVAMLAIQLTDEILFTTGGYVLAHWVGADPGLYVTGAQLLWLFVSVLLYGWYVAMLTDDPLALRAVVRAIRPQWLCGFFIVLGSLLPVLAIAMAFRIARGMGLIEPVSMAIISGILNAVIVVVTAAAYFAIYRLARAQV